MNFEKRNKITIIGAGNVGATSAMRILEAGLGDVVLLDIAGGIAKAKAEDLMDAASLMGHGCKIYGATDYNDTKDSNIVVITAGLARKPGMTREELLQKNTSVIKDVTANFMKFNENPIVIVVTNPLDIMSYVVYKESNLSAERVFGMAGCLDSSRMNLMASRILNKPLEEIESMVLGTHGETMVPVISRSKVEGMLLSDSADQAAIKGIVDKTKSRGAEIVSYMGTGSAFYAPSAGVFRMVKSVLYDTQEVMPCSCLLRGEYGINDIYLGVPCQLGKEGVEDIIEIPLDEDEKKLLHAASESVRNQIEQLKL
jgi:malate dehydrogenase